MSITTYDVKKAAGAGIAIHDSNSYGEYYLYANGVLHMTGWGYVTWPGTAYVVSKTVTLPYEVSDSKLIRGGCFAYGYKTSDPTSIIDTTGQYGLQFDILCSSSTTQIVVRASYPSSLTNTYRLLYTFDLWARWS